MFQICSRHACRHSNQGSSVAQWQAEAARAKADAEASVAAIEARANAGVERLEEQLKGKTRAESEAEVRVHSHLRADVHGYESLLPGLHFGTHTRSFALSSRQVS